MTDLYIVAMLDAQLEHYANTLWGANGWKVELTEISTGEGALRVITIGPSQTFGVRTSVITRLTSTNSIPEQKDTEEKAATGNEDAKDF